MFIFKVNSLLKDVSVRQTSPSNKHLGLTPSKANIAAKQPRSVSTKRVVKGGGGVRSRFTQNKTVLSQFSKNEIGISRFTEKKQTVPFCTMQKGNQVPCSAYHKWHVPSSSTAKSSELLSEDLSSYSES